MVIVLFVWPWKSPSGLLKRALCSGQDGESGIRLERVTRLGFGLQITKMGKKALFRHEEWHFFIFSVPVVIDMVILWRAFYV